MAQGWLCSQCRAASASATRSTSERTLRSNTRHWARRPRDPKLSGKSTASPAAASRSPQSDKCDPILPERSIRLSHPCSATTLGNGPGPSGRNRIPCSTVSDCGISTCSSAAAEPALAVASTASAAKKVTIRRIKREFPPAPAGRLARRRKKGRPPATNNFCNRRGGRPDNGLQGRQRDAMLGAFTCINTAAAEARGSTFERSRWRARLSGQYLTYFRVVRLGARALLRRSLIPLGAETWSVDLQEAYSSPEVVLQRHFPEPSARR